jgi:hypothetical protein
MVEKVVQYTNEVIQRVCEEVADNEHFTAALNVARFSQYTICAKALAVGSENNNQVCINQGDSEHV